LTSLDRAHRVRKHDVRSRRRGNGREQRRSAVAGANGLVVGRDKETQDPNQPHARSPAR
jgi:hypothetical protein